MKWFPEANASPSSIPTTRYPGIERESTPGTPISVPKLWEKELERALTTHYPWPMDFTPRKLTLRERLRLLWWRALNRWPLQWKRDDDDA